MLESIFTKLLILSVQAGFLILAILIIRALFKKIPKKIICLLWCMAALRLLIPVAIESPVSLVPGEQTIQAVFETEERVEYVARETEGVVQQIPPVESGIVETIDNPQLSEEGKGAYTYTPEAEGSVGTDTNRETTYLYEQNGETPDLRMLVIYLWLLGTVILFAYGVFSYVRVRIKVREAVHHEENVWFSDRIDTPFLLGYIRPRIYIPFFVDKSRREYIIAHEIGHIRRCDHITKLVGYTLLSVYWFQPLVWIAYVLFCKDVEMACDEKVISELGEEKKKAYSQTLLLCSVDKHYLLANPLAFGEIDVKKRITNVLSYKKPGVIISIISVLILILAAIFFMTSGKEEKLPGTTELSEYQKEYLSTLESGTRYAVLPMEGADEPLLLTTMNIAEDMQEAFECEYCIFQQHGTMEWDGPLRADGGALYLKSDISVNVYTVSEEESPMTGFKFLEGVYYAEGDKDYEKVLEKYNEAPVVEFNNIIENSGNSNKVFTEYQTKYLKSLGAGMNLAVVPLFGADEPLLLVSEGAYGDPAFDNVQVSFFAEYCIFNNVGSINTGGTAYPIRADYEAVYLASGHSITVLTISENQDNGLPYMEKKVYSEDDAFYADISERCYAAPVVEFDIEIPNVAEENHTAALKDMEEELISQIEQLKKEQTENAKEEALLQEMIEQLTVQMEQLKMEYGELKESQEQQVTFREQYGTPVRTEVKSGTKEEYMQIAKAMVDEYAKMENLFNSSLIHSYSGSGDERYIEVQYEEFPTAQSVWDFMRLFCTEEWTNRFYFRYFDGELPLMKEEDGKLYTTFYDGPMIAYANFDKISLIDASETEIVFTLGPGEVEFEEDSEAYFVRMVKEPDMWVVAEFCSVMTKGSHDYYPETVHTRLDMGDYEVVLQDYTTLTGGPLEVAVIRGEDSATLEILHEEWQRDISKLRIADAGQILGYDCFYVYDFGLFHSITADFYAVVDGEVKQLATSFGDDPETSTFVKDLDGDGINELICNLFFSGDGRQDVRIYKRDGDRILESFVGYGVVAGLETYFYCPSYYDTESGKIVVEEYKDSGEMTKHYWDIDLSELEFVEYFIAS